VVSLIDLASEQATGLPDSDEPHSQLDRRRAAEQEPAGLDPEDGGNAQLAIGVD
jgi:hypothetical protein